MSSTIKVRVSGSWRPMLKAKYSSMSVDIRATHPRHIKKGFEGANAVEPFYAYHPVNPHDGQNDVDLDKEMLKESEITTSFDMFGQILKSKYTGIQKAIKSEA